MYSRSVVDDGGILLFCSLVDDLVLLISIRMSSRKLKCFFLYSIVGFLCGYNRNTVSCGVQSGTMSRFFEVFI